MSLFKYGNLEAEIDFTDADFWTALMKRSRIWKKT